MAEAKILDKVFIELRTRHYSKRTEEAYLVEPEKVKNNK